MININVIVAVLVLNTLEESGKLLFKCFNCNRKYFEEFDEE